MQLDPVNSAIDRVRLRVGDVHDISFLPDNVYAFYIDKNNGNEVRASVEVAYNILALLTRNTRERAGDIEVYGTDFYTNYKNFLERFVLDPRTSFEVTGAFAGGISKAANAKNDADPDANVVLPIDEDASDRWVGF